MANYEKLQKNMHRLHRLNADETDAMISALLEIDAEIKGSLQICMTRRLVLRDIEIAELKKQLQQPIAK
jgi:hypothetical protein